MVKKRKLPEWVTRLIFLIVGAVVGSFVTWLLNIPSRNLDKQFKEANSDMDRAQLVMEIIDRADPEYLPMLDSLIATIKDDEVKEAMSWIVETRKELPELTEKENQPMDKSESIDTVTGKQEDAFDSTCAIFYLKGDSIAERDAQLLQDFLMNNILSNFQNFPFTEYPIIDKDTGWYITNYPYEKEKEDSFNLEVLIFYNDPRDAKLDQRLYRAMKEGIFGIVYTETFAGGWDLDRTNEGNGILRQCRFKDVNGVLLGETLEKLTDFNFALVTPPYFNSAILDSIYYQHY